MNKEKRWIVNFHVCVVADDPYKAADKAKARIAENTTPPYIECLGEALEEDLDETN